MSPSTAEHRHRQAVRLAGVLAELGVQEIVLRDGSGDVRRVTARSTDLPGEMDRLTRESGGSVEVSGLAVAVVFSGEDGWVCVGGAGGVREAVERALGG